MDGDEILEKDSLSVTIRRKINRPGPEVLKPFKDVSTGFIADANNGRGCLHHSVKPLDPVMRLCGAAITAKCGPMDNLAAMAILDFVSPGDVMAFSGTDSHFMKFPVAKTCDVNPPARPLHDIFEAV